MREEKHQILEFLIDLKRDGKRIAGYGAPAKGNTLLNYCGVRTDFLDYTVRPAPAQAGPAAARARTSRSAPRTRSGRTSRTSC